MKNAKIINILLILLLSLVMSSCKIKAAEPLSYELRYEQFKKEKIAECLAIGISSAEDCMVEQIIYEHKKTWNAAIGAILETDNWKKCNSEHFSPIGGFTGKYLRKSKQWDFENMNYGT